MRRFIGGRSRKWDTNETLLHFYVLPKLHAPENAAFADLARRHHAILSGADDGEGFTHLVSPVEPEWLHATVQQIATPRACQITQGQLDDLIDRAATSFAQVGTFHVQAAPMVGMSGSVLDLAPDDGFTALHQVAATAIGPVLGPDALSHAPGAPHISTSYCHTDGDSGPLGSALRNARPTRAWLYVDEVSLVDVVQDAQHHQYHWSVVHRIPLKPATDGWKAERLSQE